MSPLPWTDVVSQLESSQKVVFGTHASPDGDALGSELGLGRFLKSRGKDVRIINTGGVTRSLAWLPQKGEVEEYLPAVHDAVIAAADSIVVVDISNWERLGAMFQPVMASKAVRIDLDHHPVLSCPADLSINDTSAAAVGEIVHALIGKMGGGMTQEVAYPLYVSLLTDTGSFKYSNTTVLTHRLAGDMIGLGVKPYDVYTRVYEGAPICRLRLMGEALGRLKVEPGAQLAWIALPRAAYVASGAREEDSEGIIDQVRSLEGVEVAILFKEVEPGVVKVSMRSKAVADVNAVARHFGGGGHARAAGMTMKAPLAEVEEKVLAVARKEAVRGAQAR